MSTCAGHVVDLDDVPRQAALAVAGPRYAEVHGTGEWALLMLAARRACSEASQRHPAEGTLRRACHMAAMRAVRLELRRQLLPARRPA